MFQIRSRETCKMNFFLLYFSLLFFINVTSAKDLYDRFIRQEDACFPVVETPGDECTRRGESAAQHFGYNISIFLFTQSQPDKAQSLRFKCGYRLTHNTGFDRNADTVIIIHGWLDGVCRTVWMREMKEQFFQRGRYNVILVNWKYEKNIVSHDGQHIGQRVASIIDIITFNRNINLSTFHIIGHGFGATIAGFAGRELHGEVGRITALDPVCKNTPQGSNLNYTDAKVVDVIHTNAAKYVGFGDGRQLGHADFYPNGGEFQLSGIQHDLISLLKGDIWYAFLGLVLHFCSHLQSIQFFMISINPKGCEFVGVADTSYKSFKDNTYSNKNNDTGTIAVMGMNYVIYKQTNERLNFFLDTGYFCPYTKGSCLDGEKYPFNTNCSSNERDPCP